MCVWLKTSSKLRHFRDIVVRISYFCTAVCCSLCLLSSVFVVKVVFVRIEFELFIYIGILERRGTDSFSISFLRAGHETTTRTVGSIK